MFKVKSIRIIILLSLILVMSGITLSCGKTETTQDDLHRHPAQQEEIPDVVVLSSPDDLIKKDEEEKPVSAIMRQRPDRSSALTWTTYSAVFQTAKGRSTGVRTMLYFMKGRDCPECMIIEQQVFSDPEVIKNGRNWVFVRIDVDVQKDIAEYYNITSVPAFISLDSYGNVSRTHICETDGSVDAEKFSRMLFDWY